LLRSNVADLVGDLSAINDWSPELVVPSRELVDSITTRWPLKSVTPNYRGEVAERYEFEDGGGEIGFNSSVTQPFCGNCSRAWSSSEGALYTCLLARRGTNLGRALRSGGDDESLAVP
jgi:cyclic pyranopterin phosphate synthase